MLSQDKTMNGAPPTDAGKDAKAVRQRTPGWLVPAAWLAAVAALVLLVALPWVAPYFYIFIATEVLILGLLAASFNLVFGYTGMLSFGHAAFFGIGSYAVAMLL